MTEMLNICSATVLCLSILSSILILMKYKSFSLNVYSIVLSQSTNIHRYESTLLADVTECHDSHSIENAGDCGQGVKDRRVDDGGR